MTGALLGLIVLTHVIVACCVIPVVWLVFRKAMETHMGQFVILDQGPQPTEGAEPYEDMSGSQGKVPKDQHQIMG